MQTVYKNLIDHKSTYFTTAKYSGKDRIKKILSEIWRYFPSSTKFNPFKYILIRILSGEEEVDPDEIKNIRSFFLEKNNDSHIMLGVEQDLSLKEKLKIQICFTAFKINFAEVELKDLFESVPKKMIEK